MLNTSLKSKNSASIASGPCDPVRPIHKNIPAPHTCQMTMGGCGSFCRMVGARFGPVGRSDPAGGPRNGSAETDKRTGVTRRSLPIRINTRWNVIGIQRNSAEGHGAGANAGLHTISEKNAGNLRLLNAGACSQKRQAVRCFGT